MTDSKPASSKQRWALFCLTGKDYRSETITSEEASKIIKEGMEKKTSQVSNFIEIFNKAISTGREALQKCKPVPMVVQAHENMLDDRSPVVFSEFVADGPCGFAWITVPAKASLNKKFIKAINEKYPDTFQRDHYAGGYKYWVHDGNQSIQKKEDFANAFAKVLDENGIDCSTGSRLD